MRLLAIALAALLLLIQYPLWLGKGGMLRVWEMERQIEVQRESNSKLQVRNAALDAEVRDLKQGLEAVEYASPHADFGPPDELRNVLEKTLGVPLFQEQAMQVAITAAEFTPSEADGLRRAMATFKSSGRIDVYREKMVGGMIRRGYPTDFAERCYKQIEGFGSYGFPESHAASFAKLVWVSAWLKHHHPGAFACALLNSQPMGFYAPAQIVRDAREHGVDAAVLLRRDRRQAQRLDRFGDRAGRDPGTVGRPVGVGAQIGFGVLAAEAQRRQQFCIRDRARLQHRLGPAVGADMGCRVGGREADRPGVDRLADDPPHGFDLVLTKDAVVGGVHFFPDDPPDAIARKALRVNLSDLAAKGARPAELVPGTLRVLTARMDYLPRLEAAGRAHGVDGHGEKSEIEARVAQIRHREARRGVAGLHEGDACPFRIARARAKRGDAGQQGFVACLLRGDLGRGACRKAHPLAALDDAAEEFGMGRAEQAGEMVEGAQVVPQTPAGGSTARRRRFETERTPRFPRRGLLPKLGCRPRAVPGSPRRFP